MAPSSYVDSTPGGHEWAWVEGRLEARVPGAKFDQTKPRMALVLNGFANALVEVGKVGTMGAAKYSDNGWKSVDNAKERYTSALYQHLLEDAVGRDFDEESHLLHLAHAAWNALAILELELRRRAE